MDGKRLSIHLNVASTSVSGWLYKLGGANGGSENWKHRWFTNQGSESPLLLKYYSSDKCKPKQLKGTVDLRKVTAFNLIRCDATKVGGSKNKEQIGFQLSSRERLHYWIASEGDGDIGYWIASLGRLLIEVEKSHCHVNWINNDSDLAPLRLDQASRNIILCSLMSSSPQQTPSSPPMMSMSMSSSMASTAMTTNNTSAANTEAANAAAEDTPPSYSQSSGGDPTSADGPMSPTTI